MMVPEHKNVRVLTMNPVNSEAVRLLVRPQSVQKERASDPVSNRTTSGDSADPRAHESDQTSLRRVALATTSVIVRTGSLGTSLQLDLQQVSSKLLIVLPTNFNAKTSVTRDVQYDFDWAPFKMPIEEKASVHQTHVACPLASSCRKATSL